MKCCVINQSHLNILLNQLEWIHLDHFSALEKPTEAQLETQKLIKAPLNDYLRSISWETQRLSRLLASGLASGMVGCMICGPLCLCITVTAITRNISQSPHLHFFSAAVINAVLTTAKTTVRGHWISDSCSPFGICPWLLRFCLLETKLCLANSSPISYCQKQSCNLLFLSGPPIIFSPWHFLPFPLFIIIES